MNKLAAVALSNKNIKIGPGPRTFNFCSSVQNGKFSPLPLLHPQAHFSLGYKSSYDLFVFVLTTFASLWSLALKSISSQSASDIFSFFLSNILNIIFFLIFAIFSTSLRKFLSVST